MKKTPYLLSLALFAIAFSPAALAAGQIGQSIRSACGSSADALGEIKDLVKVHEDTSKRFMEADKAARAASASPAGAAKQAQCQKAQISFKAAGMFFDRLSESTSKVRDPLKALKFDRCLTAVDNAKASQIKDYSAVSKSMSSGGCQ